MDLSALAVLPGALQIVVDDVGWFFGNDDRYKGGPSRSAMPRRHRPEDYQALERLGRALNMKITCGLIIGEWDSRNILKHVPGATRYGEGWDNARFFKAAEAKECMEVISQSRHIEFALHGLMHWYWDKNGGCLGPEFYIDSKTPPKEHIKRHLDAFFELYRQWGFKGSVKSFLPPCFSYEYNGALSEALSEYGILFTVTPFDKMVCTGDTPAMCGVENGIITVDRTSDICRWYRYDTQPDFEYFKDSIFGFHWVNLLKLIPKNNFMAVDKWIEYFRAAAKRFGTILSKDIAFAASQALYKRYAKLSYNKNELTVDLKPVHALKAKGLSDSFYLSVKNEAAITAAGGCAYKPFDYQSSFMTYQIKPFDSCVRLKFCDI